MGVVNVKEYKWVQSDMDLYKINKDSKNIIFVHNTGKLDIDFYEYAKNFYEAAERVIHKMVEEQDIYKLDLWFYSMVYLYRHSLELMLKACIFQEKTETSDRKEIVGKIRHDLEQAFDKLIEIKGLSIDDNENAKWLKSFLKDISDKDRDSDMFRYPFGNDLKLSFDKQTHISLVDIHYNLNKAYYIIKEIYDTGSLSNQVYKCSEPKLIIEGGNYLQQSVVGYKYNQYEYYPYYTSYADVADFLKDIIFGNKKINLFMPMCYAYRNAIELGLKRLIVEDSHLGNDKSVKLIRKKKHSILGLWNSIIDKIKKYMNPSKDDTSIQDADKYINEFHQFDQHSDLFRYPCDKNMNLYFLEEKKMDIENVSSCFEELCNFLEAVDSGLIEMREYEAEYEAEMAEYDAEVREEYEAEMRAEFENYY